MLKSKAFGVKGLENVNARVEFDVEADAAGTYIACHGLQLFQRDSYVKPYMSTVKITQLGFANNPTGVKK